MAMFLKVGGSAGWYSEDVVRGSGTKITFAER